MDKDPSHKITSTPWDRVHYPSTNQTQYCWQKYNEFVVCQYKNPDNAVAACKTQLWHANNICPAEWIEKWEDEREKGTFLGVADKSAQKAHAAHH